MDDYIPPPTIQYNVQVEQVLGRSIVWAHGQYGGIQEQNRTETHTDTSWHAPHERKYLMITMMTMAYYDKHRQVAGLMMTHPPPATIHRPGHGLIERTMNGRTNEPWATAKNGLMMTHDDNGRGGGAARRQVRGGGGAARSRRPNGRWAHARRWRVAAQVVQLMRNLMRVRERQENAADPHPNLMRAEEGRPQERRNPHGAARRDARACRGCAGGGRKARGGGGRRVVQRGRERTG